MGKVHRFEEIFKEDTEGGIDQHLLYIRRLDRLYALSVTREGWREREREREEC